MANLPEKEEWEEVYQWETSDRALGGPGGVMNKPLRNLVNRTAFLKKKLDDNTGAATTNKAGIVKLNDSLDSASATEAATANAVKRVAENANGKLSKEANLSDLSSTEEALRNLGLSEAAKRDIGNGENQIPDMSFFKSSNLDFGWQKLPSGLIIQWGRGSAVGSGSIEVGSLNAFPVAFPNKCLSLTTTHSGHSPTVTGSVSVYVVDNSQFRCYRSGSGTNAVAVYYIAVGY